jgi:hypothetical protein
MRADPEPGNHVAFTQTERAIMLTNPNDANSVAPFLETK